MSKPRILALAGSTRSESFNKKLVSHASALATEAGADVSLIDLREFDMPLYDGDLEESTGLPENANRLYDLFKSHDALLLSSPEYNGSISAVLKNAIDWVSRPREGDVALAAFSGKIAGLMAASPGGLGGLRGLAHVRAVLSTLGMLVLPSQVAVAKVHEAFNDDGSLKDERTSGMLRELVGAVVRTTDRLNV